MESNDFDSDCIVTDLIKSREKISMINVKEPVLKRCKLGYEEGFHIKTIPANDHCIANCFATHNKLLDMVQDLLDSDFGDNINFYKDFSEFNEDDILREMYPYTMEIRYSNSTVDVVLNAFRRT